VQLQRPKTSQSRGTIYSIEKGVETLFAEQHIDKYKIEIDGQRVIEWTRQEVLIHLIREAFERGITDAVIRLLPVRPGGQFDIVVSAVAIPNEHQRLLDRIEELETENMTLRYRTHDTMYAPVYNLLDKANAKVDKDDAS
jgi:hypothetical protein